MKHYDDFSARQDTQPSPISVLALQDKEHTHKRSSPELDNDPGRKIYVLFKNQGDPNSRRPLLPSTQARSGETIPFTVGWGDEDDPKTHIPFFACGDRFDPIVFGGLSCVGSAQVQTAGLLPLGTVAVPKPSGRSRYTTVYLKAWVSIWGRTLTTTTFMLKDAKVSAGMDDELPSPDKLKFCETKVQGLDTFQMRRFDNAIQADASEDDEDQDNEDDETDQDQEQDEGIEGETDEAQDEDAVL